MDSGQHIVKTSVFAMNFTRPPWKYLKTQTFITEREKITKLIPTHLLIKIKYLII